MECLAILNRLSIFSSDNSERADLCTALERESEVLVPADVPLSALDIAMMVLADHTSDSPMVRCICMFLSSCALGDSQAVRKYLLQFQPATHFALEKDTKGGEPFIVHTINRALSKSVLECRDTILGGWRASVQPITDLIATLSYNNGSLRAAFGETTLPLLGRVLAKARLEEETASFQNVRPMPGLGPLSMARTMASVDTANDPGEGLYFYTVSCIAVLLMADTRNSNIALSSGVVAEVLHCYKCLNAPTSIGSARRPTSSASAGGGVRGGGRIGSATVGSQESFGPVSRFGFVSNESRSEVGKWCIQVLRNAAIASPSHPAWDSSSSGKHTTGFPPLAPHAVLDYGRMGEIILIDEMKWDLSKLRRKHIV